MSCPRSNHPLLAMLSGVAVGLITAGAFGWPSEDIGGIGVVVSACFGGAATFLIMSFFDMRRANCDDDETTTDGPDAS